MDWERHFSERVLERGLEYWLSGAVEQVVGSDGRYSAVVVGNDEYLVTIAKGDQGIVTEMSCDCPYAEGGNNCKHMAAVLYALDEATEGERRERAADEGKGQGKGTGKGQGKGTGSKAVSIKDVIDSLSIEKLRDELLQVASKDAVLAARLTAEHRMKAEAPSGKEGGQSHEDDWSEFIRAMRKRIDGIIRDCTDRDGFADWRNSGRLIRDLESEVLGELSDIVEYGKEVAVVHEVTLFLYERFASIALDGSNGEYQEFAESMTILWEELYDAADEAQRTALFSDMLDLHEKIRSWDDYLAEELFDFMLDHFDVELLNRRKLSSVEAELEKMEAARRAEAEKKKGQRRPASGLSAFDSFDSYQLAHLVLQKVRLMEQLGYERSDILDFRNAYRGLSEIRAVEMRELRERGDLPGLIALLEESKELYKARHGLVSTYSNELVSCYEKSGDRDRARDEAYAYVTRYASGSLDGFIRLRGYFTAREWEDEREKVFEAIGTAHNLNKLYFEEGLYDRVMASLKRDAGGRGSHVAPLLSEIASYEDVLRPLYGGELLALYEKAVRAMARPAGGRAGYREIVRVLRRMLAYEGGRDTVRRLLAEWRLAYANRPAMQDELKAIAPALSDAGLS